MYKGFSLNACYGRQNPQFSADENINVTEMAELLGVENHNGFVSLNGAL